MKEITLECGLCGLSYKKRWWQTKRVAVDNWEELHSIYHLPVLDMHKAKAKEDGLDPDKLIQEWAERGGR